MYTVSVNSRLSFEDDKEPETNMYVDVDGYEGYPEEEKDDWRIPLWYSLFYSMRRKLKTWEYRTL